VDQQNQPYGQGGTFRGVVGVAASERDVETVPDLAG